jgi:glycosyltransferase involved in cell wall biosynthesis
MVLGFHYHSNFIQVGTQIKVPGYIGVFIDSLAEQVDELVLFLEEQTDTHSTEEDYVLSRSNITLVSLGAKSTFYHRLLKPKQKVSRVLAHADKLDAFLLRAPSPLAPHLFKQLKSKVPVYPMLVGNYVKGLKDLQQPFVRKLAIIVLTYYYQLLHNNMVRASNVFVNSGELLEDNKKRAKHITLVKTTTLSKDSFYTRVDTCQHSPIKLLYTGRINFQKGLRELIDAMNQLKSYPLELHIVGWEEKGTFSYEDALKQLADEKGLGEQLFFHGKKQIGHELNTYYKQADIYVIPSYHEGFPRTIWEALAHSLPVIATKVGSIPYYLQNKEHALLIPPQQVKPLVDALKEILTNDSLRQHLITRGYELTQDITLDKQAQLLVNQIKNYNLE